MENKYYTPEIEEFHIGFEYETIKLKTIDMNDIPKGVSLDEYIKSKNWIDEWIPIVWNKFSSFENKFNVEYQNGIICNISVPNSIRVKYLDKEDIESLGFIYDKTSNEEQLKFYKDNLNLFYRPVTKELGAFTIDPAKNDYMARYNMDNKLVRFLIIKNKSELKKLLQQLNIK